MQRDGFGLDAARVRERQRDARVEKGELAQPVLQGREIELCLGEGALARQESDLGPGLGAGSAVAFRPRRGPRHRERRLGLAVLEAHEVLFPVAEDVQVEPLGERVHHRDADAVQAARDLVGVLVEFPAGVQLGHDDLGRRDAFLVVDVDGNAAAVVGDRAGAVTVQGHGDGVAEAAQRLVDRIVDDLVDHVMQARAVVGVADIHARALAHGIEPAQHLDRFGGVVLGAVAVSDGRKITHSQLASHKTSSSRCERRIGDGKELRTAAQSLEEGGVRAGKPGLSAEAQDLAEERAAALRVEMRRHLVEQQERCASLERGLEPRMRQHDRDQERLLLAGRALRRRHAGGGVAHHQVAPMRPQECHAGLGILPP